MTCLKALALCMLCVPAGFLFAQKKKPQNLPKHDHHLFNFGFTLGINSTDFKVQQENDLHFNDSLMVIESTPGSGFNLGIVSEMKIGNNLNLRFIPQLSFTERNMVYKLNIAGKESETKKNVQSTFLQFPVDLKLKSERINNYRFYVMAGAQSTIDMASQKKVDQGTNDPYKTILKIEKNDMGYYIGAGMDMYLQFFRFSPEIKMFHGLNNLVVKDKSVFSKSIYALHSKIFLVSFIFE